MKVYKNNALPFLSISKCKAVICKLIKEVNFLVLKIKLFVIVQYNLYKRQNCFCLTGSGTGYILYSVHRVSVPTVTGLVFHAEIQFF